MSVTTFDERSVLAHNRRLLPADGTGVVAFVPANSSDRRMDAMLIANRDTIAHVVTLLKVNGAVTICLGSATIPAGQGYAGTPSLDLLALVFPATMVGINLVAGDTLAVQLAVALQATFDLDVSAYGGAF